jgi:hypothetical protein
MMYGQQNIKSSSVKFLDIRPGGEMFFHADGRTEKTDRKAGKNDEAKSRFS